MIRTESNESIKQALRHKLRTSCEENYQNEDNVFDKRRALQSWNGSDTVLEKERNFVLIQHGSAFYRCHSRNIMKATQQKSPTTTDVKPVNKDNRRVPDKVHKKRIFKF